MWRNYLNPLLKQTLTNNFKDSIRKFMPRRAVMYIPGDDDHKLQKGLATDVDSIAMDCEDGVAITKKVQARLNIRDVLDKGKPNKSRVYELGVRVNGIETDLIKDDLAVITSGKNLPDTILLPKVDEADHLKLFSDLLNQSIQTNSKVFLIIYIESARAFVNLTDICRTAKELAKTAKFIPVALTFGSDDFCASIGATRSESSHEVIYARQKLVLVAKAFDFQAIDMVYIKYKDLEGLKNQAIEGARMGFTGKQVIHPGQVPTVQEAFLPTKKQIEWATGLIKAFHNHQTHGKGAFAYRGSMIDMPTMRQAQNIMDLVNAIMLTQP